MDVLEQSRRFADLTQRLGLINGVAHRRGVRLPVDEMEPERSHLDAIVRACATKECLAELLVAADGRVSGESMRRLRQLNDEWDGITHFPDSEWLAIRDTLERAEMSNGGALYRAVQWRNPLPAHCRSVWHMFAHLAGSNSDEEGVPLFMIFLQLVAAHMPTDHGRPLKELLAQLASSWNITGPFQRISVERERTIGRHPENAVLLILIDPHPMSADTFTVKSWYGWTDDRSQLVKGGGDRIVGWDDLEKAVQGIVRMAEENWPTDDSRLQIEFILPFSLLNLPVEQWAKEDDPDSGPVPLFMHYSVVVRSLDRIRNRSRHRVWRSRWHTLEESTSPHCLYGEDVLNHLEQTIGLDRQVVAVVLSEPPASQACAGMNEVKIAVRTGVPVIIWQRTEKPAAEFRRIIDESISHGEIGKLPDRTYEWRLGWPALDDKGTETTRDLVLLWDDPMRLPEEFRNPALAQQAHSY